MELGINSINFFNTPDGVHLECETLLRLIKLNYHSAIYPTSFPEEEEVQRDRESLSGGHPLKKSARGNKGPTFLVSYSRSNTQRELFRHAYVIKWTTQSEINCSRIYEALRYGFLVPEAVGIDLEGRIHEDTKGNRTAFTTLLTPIFQSILKNERLTSKDHHILLNERISGENLLDFALTKYTFLTLEQKTKFFTRLGRLALLDIFLGNIDRLAQVNTDQKGNYRLEDLEANLGNVMVAWKINEKAHPILYAIDNGIDKDLIDNEEARKKYSLFLKTIYPDAAQLLSENIQKSLQAAIRTQIDDDDAMNVKEAKEKLTSFNHDINTIAKEALSTGVQEMKSSLSNDKRLYETYLSTAAPTILTAIQERLQILRGSL